MSAINVFISKWSASIVADGAAYDQAGNITGAANKIWPLVHLRSVVALSGAAIAGPIVASLFGEAKSAADLKARAPERLADALSAARIISKFPVEPCRVTVAGIDDDGETYAWLMATERDKEFNLPPWLPTDIGGLCITPCTNGRLREQILRIIGTREPDQINPETDGLAILECQRQHHFELNGKPVKALGEFAQIATVVPVGAINIKILKRWT